MTWHQQTTLHENIRLDNQKRLHSSNGDSSKGKTKQTTTEQDDGNQAPQTECTRSLTSCTHTGRLTHRENEFTTFAMRSVIKVIKVDAQQQQTAESLGGLNVSVFARPSCCEQRNTCDRRAQQQSVRCCSSLSCRDTEGTRGPVSPLVPPTRLYAAGRSARHLTAESGAGCTLRAA